MWNRLVWMAAAPLALFGHFSFIVPQPGGKVAHLIVSETLKPDPVVSAEIASSAKLFLREGTGQVHTLTHTAAGDHLKIELPGKGDRIVYGQANLGISPGRQVAKPYLLLYYPKTLIGGQRGEAARVGGEQVVEIVPHGETGSVQLEVLARGKPLADAEITVVLPGGREKRIKTNDKGIAGPLTEAGRYAIWARFWEPGTGEHNGKAYEQVRHYGMLVFEATAASKVLPKMPEATSSFGAAATEDFVYVYGGHIAKTHNYATDSVSGRFSRLHRKTNEWETLPASTPLQGMNLAAHEGIVYRVGGMAPLNAPGTKAETVSIAAAARYLPEARKWEDLPPLPTPRSSHELVVAGDKLVVTGGWQLKGHEASEWAKTTLILDLKNIAAGWKEIPQPFERRALAAAYLDGKVYVLGGITAKNDVTGAVDVLDVETGEWKAGRALPAGPQFSFAPAAAVWKGALYVGLGDGTVVRLAQGGWHPVGKVGARLAHRMTPDKEGLVVLGGAAKGENFDLAEIVVLDAASR